MTTNGILTNYAGSGAAVSLRRDSAGDGGPATSAKLNNPVGLAVDALGNIYFADLNNQRIRKIDTAGVITTIAGSGTPPATRRRRGRILRGWGSRPPARG